MNIQRLFLGTFCALLLCAASGCVQPHVYYVTPTSSAPVLDGYGKEGSTIEWYVADGEGPFTVTFKSAAPCTPPSNLKATIDKPASCKLHLPKNHPGGVVRFIYTIVHDNNIDSAPGVGGQFGQRVGSCVACSADKSLRPESTGNESTAKTAPPSNYFPESITCEPLPGVVEVNPVNPFKGDTVQWYSSTGQNWKITFSQPSACPSPMTQAKGNDTCIVAGTSGQPYTYHVSVEKKSSHPGCEIDATLNVQ